MIDGSKSPTNMTLVKFIGLVQALNYGEYIRIGYSDNRLPKDVSLAFGRLDLSVTSSESTKALYPDPDKELENFITTLFQYTLKNNSPETASTFTDQAEYLLGFLFHHNICVEKHDKTENNIVSINSLISKAYVAHQEMPPTTLHFIKSTWAKKQHFPSFEKIDSHFQAYQEFMIRNENELEVLQKQISEENMKAINEKYAPFFEKIARNSLPQYTPTPPAPLPMMPAHPELNFEKFSHIIEAFFNFKKPTLHNEIAVAINHFVVSARQSSASFWNNTSSAFERMLKVLMIGAINDPNSESRNGAQLLVGFLVYQNFQINNHGKSFNLRNAIDAVLTATDKDMLKKDSAAYEFLFNGRWHESQNYPNRQDLEFSYQQQSQLRVMAQPNAFGMQSNVTTSWHARVSNPFSKGL